MVSSSSGTVSGSDSPCAAAAWAALAADEGGVRRTAPGGVDLAREGPHGQVGRPTASSGVGSGGASAGGLDGRAAGGLPGPEDLEHPVLVDERLASGTGAIRGRRPNSIRCSGESGVLRSAGAYHATTCDWARVSAT